MDITVTPTALDGVVIIDTAFFRDERGFFAETYHRDRYREHGITDEWVQDNHSRSGPRVLRGIHYQDLRVPMAKLVRCTAGAIFDVAVDLRVGSPTFGRWAAVELTAENMRQLLVPVGFGHAFQVLGDVAEVQYRCSGVYAPETEGAIRWDDPGLAIAWPHPEPVLSGRDQAAMSLKDYLERPAFRYT